MNNRQTVQEGRSSRPVILDVLPAHMATKLDGTQLSRRKRLMHKLPSWMRHWWLFIVVSVALTSAILVIVMPWRTSNELPKSIMSQASDLRIYFFNTPLPDEFKFDPSTAQYDSGLLTFQLKGPNGRAITISEQSLPPDFNSSTPQASEKVDTQAGKGVIATQSDRTVGTLLTKDKQTLILLNADSSVSIDTFKDIMRNLRPL